MELYYPGRRLENEISKLAQRSPVWVQLHEAAQRPPTLPEFGRARFEYFTIWADTPEAAWAVYEDVVARCLAQAKTAAKSDA